MGQSTRIAGYRAPTPLLMAVALGTLAVGLWGGLQRIGWNLPGRDADLLELHGPLLVLGFLGTLIGVERAVALGRAWGFLAPAGTALGAALLLAGLARDVGQLLMLGASCVLVGVLLRLSARQRAGGAARVAMVTLVFAAGLLVVANAMWVAGSSSGELVPWWTAFLVVTILAERLELSALGRLDRVGIATEVLLVALLTAALCVTHVDADAGGRLIGASYLGLVAWLARYDLARRTAAMPGFPRFVGAALAAGYGWLVFAGALGLLRGTTTGLEYDAGVHAILIGFVFSMIFAHAPIVFPAVLGVAVPFRRPFYLHLAVLHAGLVLRVTGDLVREPEVARVGALVSAIAIALFLVMTAGSAVAARHRAARPRRASAAAPSPRGERSLE